nr:hypothetical protein [Nannocystis sp.]
MPTIVDELLLGALVHDLVDLDQRGGAGEVDLGEQVADEVEAEEVEAARAEGVGDGGDGGELARGGIEGADARALMQVRQARAGAGDPGDAAEDAAVHDQDPEIAAGGDRGLEGLHDHAAGVGVGGPVGGELGLGGERREEGDAAAAALAERLDDGLERLGPDGAQQGREVGAVDGGDGELGEQGGGEQVLRVAEHLGGVVDLQRAAGGRGAGGAGAAGGRKRWRGRGRWRRPAGPCGE